MHTYSSTKACFKRHTKTCKQTGYDKNSKDILTSKFLQWKPNYLLHTKCSLQAVNSYKHSSNLSRSPQMIVCSFGSFQRWEKKEELLPPETHRQKWCQFSTISKHIVASCFPHFINCLPTNACYIFLFAYSVIKSQLS